MRPRYRSIPRGCTPRDQVQKALHPNRCWGSCSESGREHKHTPSVIEEHKGLTNIHESLYNLSWEIVEESNAFSVYETLGGRPTPEADTSILGSVHPWACGKLKGALSGAPALWVVLT